MCERTPDIRSSSSSFSSCVPNHTTLNLSPNQSNKQESSKTATNDSSVDQGINSPVASTSTQIVEHTTVHRGSSSSKMPRNDSAEQKERNQKASTPTQYEPEVRITVKDEIEERDVEVENTEVAQSPPHRMDVSCSTSAAAKKSTPSVKRSKRKRDSLNGLTSEVHDTTFSSAGRPEMSLVASASTEVQIKFEAIANDEIEDNEEAVASDSTTMDRVCSSSPSGQPLFPSMRRSKRLSTMVSKEMEKYYEGCLVIIMDDGLPFAAGMIRKPDEDMLNHAHVGSGHDEYTWMKNGVIYSYVQIFEEPVTLNKFKTGNLQLFDAYLEPGAGFWLKWLKQTPTTIANYKNGMTIAKAASKYKVEERLRKFTLRVGTSIGSLLAEIENVNSQPTTPLPPPPSNNVTVQGRDEAIAMANGESFTVSVARVIDSLLCLPKDASGDRGG